MRNVYQSCSHKFWTMFLPLHTFAGVCIDASLSAAVEAFSVKKENNFPVTKRALFRKINKIPSFWPIVTCCVTLDLSALDLPKRLQHLTFRFVDPVWAWICAAQRQPPREMHWVPKRMTPPEDSRDFYYGGGVQFGEAFASACGTCPTGTFPMLIKLHWDGAHAHGMHSTPICIGVGNTNSESADTKYCIGYMPTLNDMGGQYEGNSVEVHPMHRK